MADAEVVLSGGVANAGAVVRVGDETLRPAGRFTSSTHRFLAALRAHGFGGVPEPLGTTEDGRERLRFIDGDVAIPPYPDWVQTDDALLSIARLLRWCHDAAARVGADGDWSTEMADPRGGPIICHNDICLENVVFVGLEAAALLDWDFAAPGRPVYDLAQMLRMCVPVDDPESAARLGWHPNDAATRVRLAADAYGLSADDRSALLRELDDAIARGGEFVLRRVEAGEAPFIAMWEAMGGMRRYDRRREWWSAQRDRFVHALLD